MKGNLSLLQYVYVDAKLEAPGMFKGGFSGEDFEADETGLSLI